jgi:putative CocE/NonD family hydrolase
MIKKLIVPLMGIIMLISTSWSQAQDYVEENYVKEEFQIPMRDGTKLHTVIYSPKDKTQKYPFLMQRTPYSAGPYGTTSFKTSLGPSPKLMKEGYIFVYQDVRGRWMSEGIYDNMRPTLTSRKKGSKEIDESTDTFDTIDWLLKNISNHNGKVGQWGISYPGFYSAASLPFAHPALKAVSPQAPIGDFYFDDFHHNGAYFLSYWLATSVFGYHKDSPTDQPWYQMVDPGTKDGYQFFMDMGSLKNADKYYKEDNFFWSQLKENPDYNEFWQKRSIIPHLKNIKPAVMTVGGWFDAEDLYGPLTIYKTIEKNNPNTYNTLVMGPWSHGDWSVENGIQKVSNMYFGDSISTFYQNEIEARFFDHFLKSNSLNNPKLPEAYMFDTGTNEWRTFDTWPPNNVINQVYFPHENGKLTTSKPAGNKHSEFISDPFKPVPYSQDIKLNFTPRKYMADDQRFAARRPDVLVFETETLTEDITFAGEIMAKLMVSTSETDADWIVKLIDVFPNDTEDHPYVQEGTHMSNYHLMVRSEVIRGRYRDSFSQPKPFVSNEVTKVPLQLQDVLHTFKKGHKVQIQIQSTWFPLIDRNPQKYVENIFNADEDDFVKATHRVYHHSDEPTSIEFQIMKPIPNLTMNPLLESFKTPFETAPFDQIKPEHFLPAINVAIEEAKAEIETIKKVQNPNFENVIEALDRSGEKLSVISSIFFNLNSAETNAEIQTLAREISPLLTSHGNDIILDAKLFELVNKVYQEKDKLSLTEEQKTLLDKTFKSFVRNGANLSEDKKNQLREIDKNLSQLKLKFGENVLEETNKYELIVSEKNDLDGLPDAVIESAAQLAEEKGHKGKWMFTLAYPSYIPFMTYAKNRELRKKFFIASNTKAAKGDELDNQQIIKDILRLKNERAKLLGYPRYADFVLEERMAKSSSNVTEFLNTMLEKAKPKALLEMEELGQFAQKLDGLEKLEKWDYAFYSEKLKMEKFDIDDEVLRPYFKLENVIDGVFQTTEKLFGINFMLNESIPVYHPDVKAYEVKDKNGKHLAVLYADFFPRAGKQNGAWMTSYRGQKKINGKDERPHISIVCNFTKPTKTTPSLLTFNEVTTLFHEFGHALHGMLADGNYESLSGTSVYWDFVELPSQILENWCYEKACLDLFAKHYETGEAIPSHLLEKIKQSSNFHQGYQTLRQLSFGLLDMAYHSQDPSQITDLIEFENKATQSTSLLPNVEGTMMSTSFSHIFQGGYGAGYYSYKWAEVLDADAFELFQEKGIFDTETAESFRKNVLSAGGSEHPEILYRRFRGRDPRPEALLKRAGLLEEK